MAQTCDTQGEAGATEGCWGRRALPCYCRLSLPPHGYTYLLSPALCPRAHGVTVALPAPAASPHPHAGSSPTLLDIFISVHTYTHGSQGSFIVAFSAVSLQGLVRGRGAPTRFLGCLGPSPATPCPLPIPVVSTWGQSPPTAPSWGRDMRLPPASVSLQHRPRLRQGKRQGCHTHCGLGGGAGPLTSTLLPAPAGSLARDPQPGAKFGDTGGTSTC